MQLTQETKKVVRSGQFSESKFKIEASSKAFQILSSRLYADEYKAIVRELCTNASDAHAAAGKSDTPIVVHAPDYLDNSFSVRDYGNGIDPEEFEKIYTTYFYSTKSDSNEEVGCFGLGSKSPFAYAKQFTVENHYNGNKYIYSCFINENSEPSVTLLTTSPTTESGVKVSFPVNRDHWTKFNIACKEVLQWFTVTPICNMQIENNSFEGSFKASSSVANYDSRFFIRMGQVVYPCKSEYFDDIFNRGSYVFNVNIGDVDITPSRESLEYRTKTIATLKSVHDKVYKEVHDELERIIANSTITNFAKFKEVHQYCQDKGAPNKLRDIAVNKICSSAYTNNYASVNCTTFDKVVQYSMTGWRNKIEKNTSYIYVTANTVLLVKDKSSCIKMKIEHLLNSRKNLILIPSDNKDDFIKAYNLEESDLFYASKVELDKDIISNRVSKTTNCCELYYDEFNRKFIKTGIKLDKDVKDEMYITEGQFNRFFGVYSHLSGQFKKVYVEKGSPKLHIFTELQYKNLKILNRNFTNFLDYLVKEISTNKKDVIEYIAKDAVMNDKNYENLVKISDVSITDNLIKQYIQSNKDTVYADKSKAAYYIGIVDLINYHDSNLYSEIETAVNVRQAGLQDLWKKAEKKYPLVKILLDNARLDDIINDVASYVDLIEKEGK